MKRGPSAIIRLLRQRKRRQRRVLTPLLSAIRSEAPPSGLLHRIEREIEVIPPNMPKARSARRGYPWKSLSAAASIGIAVLVFDVFSDTGVTLLDLTGRPHAHIRRDGSAFSVRLAEQGAVRQFEKSWHLWGIVSSGVPPVHIGALGEAGLTLQNPQRFSSFAMSMEDASFAGGQPLGPVIALTAAK